MSEVSTAVTPTFSTDKILEVLAEHYQLSGCLKELPGYCDQNRLLTDSDGCQYIVKVANSGEPQIELEMQNSAMAHLSGKGCAVPQVIKNVAGKSITTIETPSGQKFLLRVLTFLTGDFYADVPLEKANPALWSDLGEFMAKIDQSLANFQHAGAYRYLDWDLAHGYRVCQVKKELLDRDQRALVDYFLNHYKVQTLPLIATLPVGIIHNDANDMNLLIDNLLQPSAITGLIDFGDMVHTQVVNELAIAAAYALMNQSEPLTVLTTLVAGYFRVRPLSDVELEVLYSLIALRLAVSVCNSAASLKESPDNDYLAISNQPAWDL